jgi:hypothetical protein
MESLNFSVGTALLLAGIGINFLSSFLLLNHPKMKGDELKKVDSKLEGVHQTYSILKTITVISALFFVFLVYQANQIFWKERAFLLFTPVFAVFALFDGLFAVRTNVFPIPRKYYWSSYIYDSDKKLRWIALSQIGLAIIILMVDFVIFVTLY